MTGTQRLEIFAEKERRMDSKNRAAAIYEVQPGKVSPELRKKKRRKFQSLVFRFV